MRGMPTFLIHLNKNTWQCDITESNVVNLITKCQQHHYPILVFGKANLNPSPLLFHVNKEFKYPYEVKEFINIALPNITKFA
jgi:hypothetical protein